MLKAISVRLDEGLLEDCKVHAKDVGVSLTDLIVRGLGMVLEDAMCPVGARTVTEALGEVVCVVEKAPPEKPKVAKKVEDIMPKILPELVAKKVASGGYFRPMPKSESVKNAGKEGKKKR